MSAVSSTANTSQPSGVVASSRSDGSAPKKNSTQDVSSEESTEYANQNATKSSPSLNLSGSPKDVHQDHQKGYSDLEASDNSTQTSTTGKIRL